MTDDYSFKNANTLYLDTLWGTGAKLFSGEVALAGINTFASLNSETYIYIRAPRGK